MTKYLMPVPILVALIVVGVTAKEADAQGFHFRSGGIHVDVGRPHHGYHGRGLHGLHGYSRHGYGRRGGYGAWGGDHYWHDTTHLDYHPGYVVPHYDHYDYVPGHYDVHRTGHWHHDHF